MRIRHPTEDSLHAWMEIRDLLIQLQGLRGWDQYELADLFGVKQPTISRWLKPGGSQPDYRKFERARELLAEAESLTNETGTDSLPCKLLIIGEVGVPDRVQWFPIGEALRAAEIPFVLSQEHVGLEVNETGLVSRAQRGDLLILGASTRDIMTLMGQDAAVLTEEGESLFGRIGAGRDEGAFSIVGKSSVITFNVKISEARPFVAVIAAAAWKAG